MRTHLNQTKTPKVSTCKHDSIFKIPNNSLPNKDLTIRSMHDESRYVSEVPFSHISDLKTASSLDCHCFGSGSLTKVVLGDTNTEPQFNAYQFNGKFMCPSSAASPNWASKPRSSLQFRFLHICEHHLSEPRAMVTLICVHQPLRGNA